MVFFYSLRKRFLFEVSPFRLHSRLQFHKMSFQQEKEKFKSMTFEEKKELNKPKTILKLSDIETWDVYFSCNSERLKNQLQSRLSKPLDVESFTSNADLNKRVSLFSGDITALFVDAVVNAANSGLRGGGGVDGAIHKAAGPLLLEECKTLNGCQVGQAKIAGGYKLPAKFVILTVGPQDKSDSDLKSCYEKCLQLCDENEIRSVAFPCISTGVYGFPHERAAIIASTTVRKFLETATKIERVIFCVFLPEDLTIYENILQKVFP